MEDDPEVIPSSNESPDPKVMQKKKRKRRQKFDRYDGRSLKSRHLTLSRYWKGANNKARKKCRTGTSSTVVVCRRTQQSRRPSMMTKYNNSQIAVKIANYKSILTHHLL